MAPIQRGICNFGLEGARYTGLHGEALPQRVTCFKLEIYLRVEIIAHGYWENYHLGTFKTLSKCLKQTHLTAYLPKILGSYLVQRAETRDAVCFGLGM